MCHSSKWAPDRACSNLLSTGCTFAGARANSVLITSPAVRAGAVSRFQAPTGYSSCGDDVRRLAAQVAFAILAEQASDSSILHL